MIFSNNIKLSSLIKGVIVLSVTGVLGCGDPKTIPFLGQWNGEFTVSKVLQGPNTPQDQKRHSLKGYLKIVLNKKSYSMHLEGEQQTIDVQGSWNYSGNQVTLSPIDVKVETAGKDEGVDPNRKWILPEDLYAAYLKKFVFRLSKDGNSLQGLDTTIVILEGAHVFKKD
jgi:hypothetical protein